MVAFIGSYGLGLKRKGKERNWSTHTKHKRKGDVGIEKEEGREQRRSSKGECVRVHKICVLGKEMTAS